MTLKLGCQEFVDEATLMMAIVNRTPDSFYDKGATWAEDKAFERVEHVVAQALRSSTSAASRRLPVPRSTRQKNVGGGQGMAMVLERLSCSPGLTRSL